MEMEFKEIYDINVSEHVEKKNGLSYLSWAYAWMKFKEIFSDAKYEIVKFDGGLPYAYDERTGIMCYTKVTAGGLTYEMWLPVMNDANKAMKFEPYTYQVWDKATNSYKQKTVEAASMWDVNKTIMRCLVKNLAMFGLGLYIYAGEDIPNEVGESFGREKKSPEQPARRDWFKEAKACKTIAELSELYNEAPEHFKRDGHKFMECLSEMKAKIKKSA